MLKDESPATHDERKGREDRKEILIFACFAIFAFSRGSLVAQRRHRIHLRRAVRGNEPRHE
jgi:hypothetical protein